MEDSKNTEETQSQEVSEEQEETQTEDTESSSEDAHSQDEQPDYEAIIAEERKRREEAEQKLDLTRQKARERYQERNSNDVDIDNIEDDKPLTKREFTELLMQDRRERQQELQLAEVRTAAKQLASSDGEASAIVEYYRSRIQPTGNVQEDVLAAYAVLNARASSQKISELRRALQGKTQASRNTAATHRDGATADEPKLAGQDIEAIKASGFKWDGKNRLYSKPIGKSKMLHFDPKTKKRFTTQK